MAELNTYILSQLEKSFSKEESNSILSILLEDISNIELLSKEKIDTILRRITSGEPTQYVTGLAPFYGHFFHVDNNVLIPRPETEELVYTIEKYIKRNGLDTARILDIGTGSGCIPITINKLFPLAQVVGLDVSEGALSIANFNNDKLQTKVSFSNVDFLDERQWGSIGQFDIIISNPPYIPNKEKTLMSANVIAHEPHLALFVEDDDPLLFYRKIFHFANRQTISSSVFLECNEFNAKDVAALFEENFETEIIQDLQMKDRIVKAIRKGAK